MYKVLLVDDEPWALSGIRDTFQWDKFGFEVLAETTVAAEALDIIFRENPDVVFTDIRMPGISGIDLMQKVREEGIDTEFVVVSGFGEFSYAQQAMRQGAFDYCLKPLDFEYADKLLLKIFQYLENKNNYKKSALFEALIENKGDQRETLQKLGLDTTCKYYQSIVLLSNSEINLDSLRIEFTTPINKIEVKLGPRKLFYLMNLDTDIKKLLDLSEISDVCIGISGLSSSPNDAEILYYEADIAANSYFLYNECKVYKYKKRNLGPVNLLVDKIFFAIENCRQDDLIKLLDEMPIFFKVNGLGIEDIVYLWNQLVAYISKRYDSEQLNGEFEFIDYTQMLIQFKNIKAVCEYLKNDILNMPDSIDIIAGNSEDTNSDFTNLISYINEHCREQLYLRDIAKMFYMNPNYCCRLFKKYTGRTFSEYLNNLRMERAVALLRTTDLTIEEIAQKAGYNDYFYFIKLFKKNQGAPPAKFRKEFLSVKTSSM